jgi:hypothetical protein
MIRDFEMTIDNARGTTPVSNMTPSQNSEPPQALDLKKRKQNTILIKTL